MQSKKEVRQRGRIALIQHNVHVVGYRLKLCPNLLHLLKYLPLPQRGTVGWGDKATVAAGEHHRVHTEGDHGRPLLPRSQQHGERAEEHSVCNHQVNCRLIQDSLDAKVLVRYGFGEGFQNRGFCDRAVSSFGPRDSRMLRSSMFAIPTKGTKRRPAAIVFLRKVSDVLNVTLCPRLLR